MTDQAPERTAEDGRVLAAVSNRVVGLYKEYYGRGPTRVKSYMQDDILVVVLRGALLRAEQTLSEMGQGRAVLEQRVAFQEAIRDRFTAEVEEIVGRRVVGYMRGSQLAPDMSAELFVLDGSADDGYFSQNGSGPAAA
ncbi:MAG: DUF2294 domain-containing protein [Thermoleophilaceae bacterium]